ncbi:MAG TPA: hypothetical protein VN643_10820 [Pyrinomonadaceae bacterium]|nr:hypothetical protein [Pyrinomonadaceae bacterium]
MSIENEICTLTGANDVNESLFEMGLLRRIDEPFSLVTISEWWRSGAETYSYIFDVKGDTTRRVILKACVALVFGRSIDTVLDEWLKRRSMLESLDVATPTLFGHGNGTILEEYIFLGLDDAFRRSSEPEALASALGHVAAVFVYLGFRPNQPFHDMRSRGSDVVVIDFGEDLGSPNNPVTHEDLDCTLQQLIASLEAWQLPKRPELEQVACDSFWKVINSQSTNQRKGKYQSGASF